MNTDEFDAYCEAMYDSGEWRLLAQVIAICGHDGIPLPLWAAKAFGEGTERVRCGECKWTDVLGGALKKGQHASALARQERLMWKAYLIFTGLSRPANAPGTKLLRGDWDKYAAVCDRLAEAGERISPTTLKGYIKKAERRLALHVPAPPLTPRKSKVAA